MSEQSERLKRRTMTFALDVCALIRELPFEEPGPTVKHQLARAATGVAFNYRSSCRARSHAEFTARMGVVVDEADESLGWLEFVETARLIQAPAVARLLQESRELLSIMSTAAGTARSNERNRRSGRPIRPTRPSITRSPDPPITR